MLSNIDSSIVSRHWVTLCHCSLQAPSLRGNFARAYRQINGIIAILMTLTAALGLVAMGSVSAKSPAYSGGRNDLDG